MHVFRAPVAVVATLALLATSVCVAQEDTRPSLQVTQIDPALLKLLPDQVAQYAARFGAGRSDAENQVKALPSVNEWSESTAVQVIQLLRPPVYSYIDGPVTFARAVPNATTKTGATNVRGKRPNAESTRLIAGTALLLDDASVLEFGDKVQSDDEVEAGLILNAGHVAVAVQSAGGALILAPGEALIVRDAAGLGTIASGCGVSCVTDYFACCIDGTILDTCKCRAYNGAEGDSDCTSGGIGSGSCSVGTQ